MPVHTSLSMPLRTWRCASCRHLSTSSRRNAVGPESPRYIEVPEPPQQTSIPRPRVKGVLPVPRNVFKQTGPGRGMDRASQESLAAATQEPAIKREQPEGSRQAWKARLSEQRRQNLREGLTALRSRQETTMARLNARGAQRQRERQALLEKPEDESERLTAPSHNLDVESLLHGRLQDPTRETRLQSRRDHHAFLLAKKQSDRQEALHSLYMQARSFIVDSKQLDAAVDKAFGTEDYPVAFGGALNGRGAGSVWAWGRPDGVKEMMARANGQGSRAAVDSAAGVDQLNKERIRRIAEALTGGAMDDERT